MPSPFRVAVLSLLLTAGCSVNAQSDVDSTLTPMVVQLTGVVVEGDSLGPVPFATVYRARDQRGTITDEYGFFAIPARVGDTVTGRQLNGRTRRWLGSGAPPHFDH